jgi:hypothetical protein
VQHLHQSRTAAHDLLKIGVAPDLLAEIAVLGLQSLLQLRHFRERCLQRLCSLFVVRDFLLQRLMHPGIL